MREVREHHTAGVDFKLHPRRISKSLDDFKAEHETISQLAMQVWLWLESRRLNQPFSSAHNYAFSDGREMSRHAGVAKCFVKYEDVWR